VILNARSKPCVNLLWLGTGVMTLGFLLATWRRLGELGKAGGRDEHRNPADTARPQPTTQLPL